MAPRTGLALDESAAHYMPQDRLTTWEEYDEKLEEYGEALKARVRELIRSDDEILTPRRTKMTFLGLRRQPITV